MNSYQNDEESPLIDAHQEPVAKKSSKVQLIGGGVLLLAVGSIAASLRSDKSSTSAASNLQVDSYGGWSERYGGGGGSERELNCKDGYDGFVDLFKAQGGGYVDKFGMVCRGNDDKGFYGGSGGGYGDKLCASGFDAMKVQYGDRVGKVWGKCVGDGFWSEIATNNGDDGKGKGNTKEFWCEGGKRVSSMKIRSGGAVDALSFRCKSTFSYAPTTPPTFAPSGLPTFKPTAIPTTPPTFAPSALPTFKPTANPTLIPTAAPSALPTLAPNHGQTDDYKDWSPVYGDSKTTNKGKIIDCGDGYGGFIKDLYAKTEENWASNDDITYIGVKCFDGSSDFAESGSGGDDSESSTNCRTKKIDSVYIRYKSDDVVLKIDARCDGTSEYVGIGGEGGDDKKAYYTCPSGTQLAQVKAYMADSKMKGISFRCKAVSTVAPTLKPTTAVPTLPPIANPTATPISNPTAVPISNPTGTPISNPTAVPFANPTLAPISSPTGVPISYPTPSPISNPTETPISSPTGVPISKPTQAPIPPLTMSPISDPTPSPISNPTETPISSPTDVPISAPTEVPISDPTDSPISDPTASPISEPSAQPVADLTEAPVPAAANFVFTDGVLAEDESPVVGSHCALFAYHAIQDSRVTPYVQACASAGSGELQITEDDLKNHGIIVNGKSHMSQVVPGKNTKLTIFSSPTFSGGDFSFVVHGKAREYPPLTHIRLSNHELANDNVYSVSFEAVNE